MQNGSSRKSNIARKTSTGIARRTLILAAVAALGITAAGKSAQAVVTEQVQDYNGAVGGLWGTAGNWAGGAGATVPNNGTPANTVYVIDTGTGNGGPVDLHGGSFTIAGIGNISSGTLHLTEIENTTTSDASLTIDPNSLPIPAASTLNSNVNATEYMTLQFGHGAGGAAITSTVNGNITGFVHLNADGPSGSLILNGANTYDDYTFVENGATLTVNGTLANTTVKVDGSGNTFNVNNSFTITSLYGGGGSVVIGNGDTLSLEPNSFDNEFDGIISGSGALTIAGNHGGAYTLAGNNTYTGGSTINANGTLDVTGSIEGPVTSNGTFEVNNSFTVTDLNGGTGGSVILGSDDTLTVNNANNDTYAGTVSGAGGLTVESSGSYTQTLSGHLSYTGTTTVDSGGSLTITGSGGDKIGAMVDDGTVTIDPNVTVTDLNGSGTLNIDNSDVFTVDTHNSDTFSGTLTGSDTTSFAVDGISGGSQKLSGDLTGFSGSLGVSKNGVLDISTAANTPDTSSSGAYEGGDTVHYWVNFDNTINFGSVHAELITGNGNITSAQSTSFSNSGYTNQLSLGEELSGPINLNVTNSTTLHITSTINASGDTTLISGAISSNTNPSRLELQDGTFILSNTNNSTDFANGSLKIDDATVQFDHADELPKSSTVPIDLDNGTLQPTAVVTVANTLNLSFNGGTLDVGDSGSYYDDYYDVDPVVFSGVIQADYTGSPGTLSIINSVGSYRSIELTGVNTYSTSTTIGGSGHYVVVFAGNNSAFGTGSLILDNRAGLGTSNDIESGITNDAGTVVGTGAYGATPIHITVGSFNSTADSGDGYVDLAVTGQATNISGTSGHYTVTLSTSTSLVNTTDNTNDAIVATGTGGATISPPELYLEFDPLESGSGVHSFERPYDFSQYVVVEASNNTGAVSGEFDGVYGDTDAFMEQKLVTPNGAGGPQYLVTTVLTEFEEFARNSNARRVGNYLDDAEYEYYISGGASASPAFANALVTLSQGSYAQIAQILNEITPVDYASLGDQAIQNSTYESQQIFGQIDSAFSVGGFNSGGLALLKTSGTAPDPFSTALQSSLNTSAQMAQNMANVSSLSSVNFMDDTDNGAGSPNGAPVPEQETPESQLSGFVSGDIVMSTLPEGNSLGQPHYTTGGVTAGIDYRLNENWIVGGYFNYGYTGATLDYLGSRQQSSSYSPGIFAGYQNGPWFIDALGSYTYNDYRIDRNFSMPGAGTATGKPTSNQFDLASLFGLNIPVARNVQMGPAGGFAYTYVNSSSFSETGSPFDLNVSSHTVDSLRSLLGGQAKFTCPNTSMPLDVNFNAFWQHEFLNGAGGFSAGLSNVSGGGTFLFTGTGPTRDSALVGGGVSGQVTQNITVFANYESQIGDKDVFGQSIIAGLAISFK